MESMGNITMLSMLAWEKSVHGKSMEKAWVVIPWNSMEFHGFHESMDSTFGKHGESMENPWQPYVVIKICPCRGLGPG